MTGGEKRWREAEQLVIEQFRLITTTLLSLLLPLSFLLLSRLSSAAFLLSLSSTPQNSDYFFLNTIPALLYAVVSIITVHTLIHCLITKIRTSEDTNRSIGFYYPRVSIAWLILLILQFSVGLGLQVTMSKGVNGIVNGNNHNFLTRLLFFFGLLEMILQWYRVIVKTVVESGFGGREEETVVERVALAASCGALWWWKLREEVEALVGVMEVKRALLLLSIDVDYNLNSIVDLGTIDFLNWLLYYLIVTIGVVRIVKGCFGFGMILLFEQVRRIPRGISSSDVNHINQEEDKV
ncbi:hypothetical protein ARALYDRAFT_920403 [Arabidopsis lyrata subsp. lyrata]|uniref:Transmembrane protein n=1 Tax=Arabidopsis lyrata subsp. lyrata TaxID=81972 RepID=D7MX04_ARALL|nr:uncharacterized protein LOC9298747 [Arabidopsis lyrata subsp. lyrata]EFH38928.1 hypothetical protein ARALYDRAFT_920403 [Arabidopsis lyrata subsp. lyrata]|eukprot:XP_002862670.1 uncharacterized protein LOC9298747 [Arabidopsis lyrata subsp. lyrata]